jgi:hypothetical protein
LKSDGSLLKKISYFFAKFKTMEIASALLIIGMLFFVVLIFTYDLSSPLSGILIAISFFFFGLSSLPIIIRQEIHIFIVSIYGFPAQIIGIIYLISCFALSIMLFIGILKSLAR